MANPSSPNSNPKFSRLLPYILASLPFIGLGFWFGVPALLDWLNPNLPKPEPAFLDMQALLRVQRAYHLEDGRFTEDMAVVQEDLGLRSQTAQYQYAIAPSPNPTVRIEMTANPLQDDLKSYSGAVVVIQDPETQKIETIATLCQSEQPQTTPPAMPILSNQGQLTCPEGKAFQFN
ncbi:MAG: hypothetical protein F6J87_19360 [Spirulina sp. SIO3F2]|nr:hypothetical protein [Spirulina sp. SIO3F2]